MRKAPVLEITIPLLAAATIFVALPTKSAYLDMALADSVLAWARPAGGGLTWMESHAQTGLTQGAAGISASLLRLYLVIRDRAGDIVRFPDEVFIP